MTPVTYVRASVSSHSSGGRLRQRYDQNPAADPRSSIGRTLQWVPGHGLPRSDPGNGHACICERTIEWQLITAGIAWIRGLAEPWRLKEATMGTHAMTLRRKETTEHVPRGRRGRLGLAPFTAATLVSLALLAPSTASAFVTIGGDLSGPGTTTNCGFTPPAACTVMQTALPGRMVTSPIDGVVVRARVRD